MSVVNTNCNHSTATPYLSLTMPLKSIVPNPVSKRKANKAKLQALDIYTYNTITNQSLNCIDYITQGSYFGGYFKSVRCAYDDIDRQLLYMQYNAAKQCIYLIDKTDDIRNTDVLLAFNVSELVRVQGQHFVANNLLYRNVYSIQLTTTQYEVHVCTHNVSTYRQWRAGLEDLIRTANSHKRCSSVPFDYNALCVETYSTAEAEIQVEIDGDLNAVETMSRGATCNVLIRTGTGSVFYNSTSVLYHKLSRQHKHGILLLYLPVDDCKSLLSVAIDHITDVYVGCRSAECSMSEQCCITLVTQQRTLHIKFDSEVIRDTWLTGLYTVLLNAGKNVCTTNS